MPPTAGSPGWEAWPLAATAIYLLGAQRAARARHPPTPPAHHAERALSRRHRVRSARGEPGDRLRDTLERSDSDQLTVRAHGPAEDLLGVGVDRIEIAAVARDRFVAHALLAPLRRRSHGIAQVERAVGADRIARDGPIAKVGDVGEAPVVGDGRPAHLAAGIADRTADRRELAGVAERIRRRRRGTERAAERLGDDHRP